MCREWVFCVPDPHWEYLIFFFFLPFDFLLCFRFRRVLSCSLCSLGATAELTSPLNWMSPHSCSACGLVLGVGEIGELNNLQRFPSLRGQKYLVLLVLFDTSLSCGFNFGSVHQVSLIHFLSLPSDPVFWHCQGGSYPELALCRLFCLLSGCHGLQQLGTTVCQLSDSGEISGCDEGWLRSCLKRPKNSSLRSVT